MHIYNIYRLKNDKINDTSMGKGWIIKQLEILGKLTI